MFGHYIHIHGMSLGDEVVKHYSWSKQAELRLGIRRAGSSSQSLDCHIIVGERQAITWNDAAAFNPAVRMSCLHRALGGCGS